MDKKLSTVKKSYIEEATKDVEGVIIPVTKEGVVVNCDVLRVRGDHEKDADIIATLPAGTLVTINGDAIDGFFNIAAPDDVFGWCMKQYIETL